MTNVLLWESENEQTIYSDSPLLSGSQLGNSYFSNGMITNCMTQIKQVNNQRLYRYKLHLLILLIKHTN